MGKEEEKSAERNRARCKAKKETAVTLSEMGMTVEKIALAVKESTDLVQKWIAEGVAAVK